MNPTKSRSKKPPDDASPHANAVPPPASAEVLTLAEAAAYLRVAEAAILRLAQQQHLPGRQIDGEWRFLKSALQEWLRTPPPLPSKEAVLSRVGSWKDDPYLDEELREIYRQRGRPMTEDES